MSLGYTLIPFKTYFYTLLRFSSRIRIVVKRYRFVAGIVDADTTIYKYIIINCLFEIILNIRTMLFVSCNLILCFLDVVHL